VFIVPFAMFIVPVVIYTMSCLVCSVQCAVYSIQCPVCSVQCEVCYAQYVVCSVQCTMCSVQVSKEQTESCQDDCFCDPDLWYLLAALPCLLHLLLPQPKGGRLAFDRCKVHMVYGVVKNVQEI
jgi:hypothetical protein